MRTLRGLLVATPLLVAALALTGCVQEGETPESSSTPTSSRPTPTSTQTPEPTTEPTVAPTDPEAAPVTTACSTLVTLDEMYNYNPNFALLESFTPDAGSLADAAVAANGVACRWVHESSGETLDISVATPTATALEERRAGASTSSGAVSDLGGEGYFAMESGLGVAQVFTGAYWVTAASPAFFSSGDVAPIMTAVLAALG